MQSQLHISHLILSFSGVLLRLFGKTKVTSEEDIKKWASKREVKKLLKAIDEKNPLISSQAVEALIKIGDSSTAEPLLRHILNGNDTNVSTSRTIVSIGRFSYPKTIPLYIEILSIKTQSIDRGAATALNNFGVVTVEPLIVALKSTDLNTRQWAAQLLGMHPDPRSVEPLIATLDDNDDNIRLITADALANIGDRRAVEPLKAKLAKKRQYTFVERHILDAIASLERSETITEEGTRMENPRIIYGPCTVVLRFKADQEEQYRNHIKFRKALVAANQLTARIPQVRLYSLKANTSEEFPFMIVITGERQEYMQITYPQGVLAQKETEIIMKEFNGNFRAVTPDSSVTNTPNPGQYITSLSEFDKTLLNIQSGRYSVAII